MSVITIPADLVVERQDWGQQRFDMTFQSGDTGASQTRILGPSRMVCGISSASELEGPDSAVWRAFIMSLRGRVNQVAMYDMLSPLPRGTASGSIVVQTAAAAGTNVIALNGGSGNAGKSLLRGDWIGVNQGTARRQMLQIVGDDSFDANGQRTFSFEPVLRWPVSAASVVVIDKPTCLMRQTTDASKWSSGVFQGGFSLDLMESWE
jgi:hypothetical protein